MASRQNERFFPANDYLIYERAAAERHEFLAGNIYKMADENSRHSTICFNLYAVTGKQLRDSVCRGFPPHTKIVTDNRLMYSYPDLAIVCGKPEFCDENEDVLLNPAVICEVISPATEYRDRVEKFMHYTNYIETLKDYVLISQEQPLIEHYAKQSEAVWSKIEIEGINSIFYLPTIRCGISLAELYDLVEFL